MTKVLVCGGRDYQDEEHVYDVLDRLHTQKNFTLVIHGACGWDADKALQTRPMTGADAWADGWATSRKVPKQRVLAHWTTQGNPAGPIRNQRMVDEFKPDLVVAFPGNKGTNGMLRIARKAGIPVLTVVDRPPQAIQGDEQRKAKT